MLFICTFGLNNRTFMKTFRFLSGEFPDSAVTEGGNLSRGVMYFFISHGRVF